MFRDLPRYDSYVRSSVSWAPLLPAHWSLERGKSLFRRVQRVPNESDGVVTCFRDGVVTLRSRRRTSGFTESLKEIGYQGIRRGDLVIHAMDAFAGAVGVSDSDGKGTPVYSVCVPRSDANPHYFAAVVREMARTSWIQSLAKGVRERSTDFRFEAFGGQRLPVPSPQEQAAIVKYLAHANARIDKAITAKRRLIALLEEQQREERDSVVRGDDFPKQTRTTLPWIPEVPDAWDVVRVKHVLEEIEQGWSPQCDAQPASEDEWGVMKAGCSNYGRFRPEENKKLSAGLLAKPDLEIQHGDLLVSRANTRELVGSAAVALHPRPKLMFSDKTFRLKVRTSRVDGEFLALAMSARSARDQIEAGAVGASHSMQNIGQGVIANLWIALPSLTEQRKVVSTVAEQAVSVALTVEKTQREITLLQEFRTRLVADVVTGQVDVRAVAATLPEAPETVADLAASSGDELGDLVEEL